MNLLEYPHEHESVAQRAAAIFGQDWSVIAGFSRERWLSAVKDAAVTVNIGGSGITPMDQAACQAVREWQESQGENMPKKVKAVKSEPVAASEAKPKGKR